jgi:small GTP-binding protein
MAMRKILGPKQDELVAEVRHHLGDLQAALAALGAAEEDQVTLRKSARQLDELFLLVVVGEFNAGKSAFINALLGERVLEEGVTPTTTRIQMLKHGSVVEVGSEDGSTAAITAPLDLLWDINIVDTPGTNALERRHEAITQEFVPRADLVFFVTSADRPFTESERTFLERIREWGKKVVFVVNKIDILETTEDVARIESFIVENARRLLHISPEIFSVSARLALHGKQHGFQTDLARSRFEELERYIVSTLDEKERFRLKLLNPLSVGVRLVEKYRDVLESRLGLLKEDLAAIEDIQNQLNVYKEDMTRGFRLRLSDVEKILLQFESRGNEFFEETIRLGRIFDLVNKARIKADFERKVIGDAPKLVEQRVEEIIDWLVSSDLQQWQAVRDHLARRRSEHADRIVGQMGGGFDYDRSRLLDSVGRGAQRTLETYDKDVEASRMADWAPSSPW